MKKIEILESDLLREVGLGTTAKVCRSVFYRHKKFRVTAHLFDTDAAVKKYWAVRIYENRAEIFRKNLFDVNKEKTVEDLRQFLFDFFKL